MEFVKVSWSFTIWKDYTSPRYGRGPSNWGSGRVACGSPDRGGNNRDRRRERTTDVLATLSSSPTRLLLST